MRIGIFSDVHANLHALEAVLAALDAEGADYIFCLGDVVGYGAFPVECLARTREVAVLVLAGNHDHVACGRFDIEIFNFYARQAALWTIKALSVAERRTLESLPFIAVQEGFTLAHGSLYRPEAFHYIETLYDAEENFAALDNPVLFYGHTHVPLAFFNTEPMTYSREPMIYVEPAGKTLVNVGSVGQPRGGDPRACYAVYDLEQRVCWLRRVEYDVAAAAKAIAGAGLPHELGDRLSLGM